MRYSPIVPVLLLCVASIACGGDAVALVEPADGLATVMTTLHFMWRAAFEPKPRAMGGYAIQIAADAGFASIVDEDRVPGVITRYVPDKELPPGEYWWRVAVEDEFGRRGSWSAARRFRVVRPERVFNIARDAGFASIQATLADAASHTPAIVQFEKGDYRLDPGGAAAFLAFNGASDLIIDGGGANFTFTGFLKFVRLEQCRRILLRNFSLDFDPLPYTAARVLSVDVKAGAFDAEIAPGHPLPESNPHFDRDRKGMIVDGAFPRMKRGVSLILEHAGWKKIAERRYRFSVSSARRLAEVSPGDVYVLDPRIATGFDVNACDEVVFFNIVAYAIANEGFNSHYSSRHGILHCGIRLKPGRFLAANNGGHNHHSGRIGPWIEGCTWENTGDDICHINALAIGVERRVAADRVRLPLHNPYDAVGAAINLDIQPGDELDFFNRAAGRLVSRRHVIEATASGKSLEVALDGDVGDVLGGRPGPSRANGKKSPSDEAFTQVFDASRTCNQFVFRNNIVRNGRRVGVLAKGHGGLIENNLFEGLGGGAVEFWNAPVEGLGAVDYVVRGNQIRDCGLIAREHAAIWATIFKTGADRLHRNLLIADNQIFRFPPPAILLRDTDGAVVRGNRIELGSPVRAGEAANSQPITLINTASIELRDNVTK